MAVLEHAERSLVRLEELAESLRNGRKERDNVTLAEAAQQIGVSAATLSRIEQEKFVPKYDTLAKICEWLGEPVERYLEIIAPPVVEGDTLKEIEVHLRADKKLSRGSARELMGIIKTLYERYSSPEKTQ